MRYVKEFVVEDTMFEGQDSSSTALELIETTAQILNSTFVSNRNGSYRECFVLGLEHDCEPYGGFIGGAIIVTNSTVNISQSRFEDNGADWGGAIFAEQDSIININGSVFVSNSVNWGGGVLGSIYSSTITIEASEFYDNSASAAGVLASSLYSTITIEASEFHDNSAEEGGVLHSFYNSTIKIKASEFHHNSARLAGVLASYHNNTITIETSEFHDNSAEAGGVQYLSSSNLTIEASEFHDNSARYGGGVLYSISSNITIASSNFTSNVSPIGAIIHATSRSVIQHTHSYFLIHNNIADRYAVIYLSDSELIGDDSGNATVTFSNNLGSLVAFNSNITFNGYATFVNNQPSQTVPGDFQEGGAMTLFQSNVFFDGECNLEHNYAENGG